MAEVVDVCVTFLLGIEVMKRFNVLLKFEKDIVISKCDGWKIPMTRRVIGKVLRRKLGYAYIQWSP